MTDMSLEDAKQWLRQRVEEGAHCLCCTQFAKVYRRKITSSMAQALVLMHRDAGDSWVHMPTLLQRKQHDDAKSRYWGLIEEENVLRPDGGRSGWWRLTDQGSLFVQGHITVPKYARVYDGRCLGIYGEQITIVQALADRFDYAELMGRVT